MQKQMNVLFFLIVLIVHILFTSRADQPEPVHTALTPAHPALAPDTPGHTEQ